MPLVLAQVADQVAEDQEVGGTNHVHPPEAEVVAEQHAREQRSGRIEHGQQDGDAHRGPQAPAHADARDDEHVQQEEGAHPALGEQADQGYPGDVGGRGIGGDVLLMQLLAAHQDEQEGAVDRVRGEDQVAELGANGGLFGIHDDHRQRDHALAQARAVEVGDAAALARAAAAGVGVLDRVQVDRLAVGVHRPVAGSGGA